MICWYKYRCSRGVFGEFQADTDDVKQLLKSRRHTDLFWLVVKLQKPNGDEYWIWSEATREWHKKTTEPYWCKFPKHDFRPISDSIPEPIPTEPQI